MSKYNEYKNDNYYNKKDNYYDKEDNYYDKEDSYYNKKDNFKEKDEHCDKKDDEYKNCEGKDIYIDKCDCEVKVDIITENKQDIFIWGNVKDSCNRPVKEAKVILLKYVDKHKCELKPVGYTHTDNNGFYKFKLPADSHGEYRIVVVTCEFEKEACCYTHKSYYKDDKQEKEICDTNKIKR